MIEAILWDHDGVLVDTETLFFETTREAFQGAGLNLAREEWALRYLAEGKTSREIALSLGGRPGEVEKVIHERNQRYRRLLEQPPPWRPHARETLAALRGQVKLALVTGCQGDQLDLVHGNGGLLFYFDVIVTADQCSRSKPDPEPYLVALRALGVNAAACLAVEDSPRGLASARAAGIRCVVVPTELTRFLDFPGALTIEEDVSGVLRHLAL